MPILGIMASQISGHLWAPEGAYDALATVTLSATTASITFSGIPTGYKHLQVRGILNTNAGTNNWDLIIRLNSDSSSNYATHSIRSDGANANAEGYATQTSMWLNRALPTDANIFGGVVIDFLDYANTSKYKTMRGLSGQDRNGAGQISLNSGLWMNTAAMSSLTFTASSGSFITYSSLALFGVR